MGELIMKTKKFPVSITFKDSVASKEEFIVPFIEEGKKGFCGIKTGKECKYGVVSYIGKEIDVNDVFAKLVDSGQRIIDVDRMLSCLTKYLEELQNFKIGNVISISYLLEGKDFLLKREAIRPPTKN
jgi:hypothetical protein